MNNTEANKVTLENSDPSVHEVELTEQELETILAGGDGGQCPPTNRTC